MRVSFEGIGEVVATFLAQDEGALKPGDVVCLVDDNQVGLGSAGTVPCGVAATIAKDGCVGVQIGGFAQVAYSGTAPVPGWNTLAADGKGGVSVGSGAAYLVACVDAADGTAVIKL